jgi:hypothetical protein
VGRIRTIKPEFPTSRSIRNLSRDARLLFILLWTVVDDGGRYHGDADVLVGQLYPSDADAQKLLPEWLGELEAEGCIARYEVKGALYLRVVNWEKHQKINRRSGCKFPDPEEVSTDALSEGSVSPHNPLTVGPLPGPVPVPVPNLKDIPDFLSENPRPVDSNRTPDGEEFLRCDANQANPNPPTDEEPNASELTVSEEPVPSHQSKLQVGIIASLFAHFCTVCGHNPARYTLTPQRGKKALVRLQEQIKLTGSLALAVDDMRRAIDNLAASEYHVTHGYLDWEAQIFRPRETFEKRLNWKQTQEVSHGSPRGYESIDQHNARVLREANERLAQCTAKATGELAEKDEEKEEEV